MSLENIIDYSFTFTGDLKKWPGIKIELIDSNENKKIGRIFLVDIDSAYDYEPEIKKNLDTIKDYNMYDFIKETNTTFLHDLFIEDNYRNKKLAQKIRIKSEIVSKNFNYKYICSTTKKENIISQHINKKLNYKIFSSTENFDFFIKEL